MKNGIIFLIGLLYGALSYGASSQHDTAKSRLIHTVYLIGDVGDDTARSAPSLNLLSAFLKQGDATRGTVVFLGDNIYPEGLHKKDHKLRAQDERRLDIQLDAVKNYPGKVVFIPGNHDWQQGGRKGDNFVRRQEAYIRKRLKGEHVFLPQGGCPGPVELKLTESLTLLIIDTQWWIHGNDKPRGEQDNCSVLNKQEFIAQFADELKGNRNRHILIAAHHPLYSNGHHGGKFSIKDHIFPLTAANKHLYIPLPVIGSIYPMYRKMLGDRQDIPHPLYQSLKNNLESSMDEYDHLVYAAGHEHNLQYVQKGTNHHIVSGSGSKATYLRKRGKMEFGARKRGFSRLLYYANGEVWMEFHSPDSETGSSLLFRKLLYVKKVVENKQTVNGSTSYAGQMKSVVPDSTYRASGLKKIFMGSLNREVWTTALNVPVLDINKVKG